MASMCSSGACGCGLCVVGVGGCARLRASMFLIPAESEMLQACLFSQYLEQLCATLDCAWLTVSECYPGGNLSSCIRENELID